MSQNNEWTEFDGLNLSVCCIFILDAAQRLSTFMFLIMLCSVLIVFDDALHCVNRI